MVLLFKDEAVKKAGMTVKHAEAFQKVADDSLCIIMCRSVNLACTGLIEEGYASKGFKVKAKSCDWGPAAGFIAADPRFSKKGSAITVTIEQLAELHNAYKAHKDSQDALVPLYLSDKRVAYLRRPDNIPSNQPLIKVTAEDKGHIYCEASPPSDPSFLVRFVLKKEAEGWAVYYADGQTARRYVGQGKSDLYATYEKELTLYEQKRLKEEKEDFEKFKKEELAKLKKEEFDKLKKEELQNFKEEFDKLRKEELDKLKGKLKKAEAQIKDFEQVISKGDIRVMGVANPTYIESHQGEKGLGYKRAVTGDYDLFAMIALAEDKISAPELEEIKKVNAANGNKYKLYDHEGIDKRPIMIGARTKAELAAEDAYLGNITKRIDLLRQDLNREMQVLDKFNGRNMVHHSDEAGRPFDPDLEYPVIAFVPTTLMQFISKLQSPQLKYAMETLKTNTVFAVENHNDLANLFAAVQTKFALMVNTSWVEPLKVAFKRGETPMNCSVPKWQENNASPYTMLQLEVAPSPVAASK